MTEIPEGDIEQIAESQQELPVPEPDASDPTAMSESAELDQPPESLPEGEIEAAVELPAWTLLDELTEAIAQAPDAPVNYVLRGEALLEERSCQRAAEDFEMALKLADALLDSAEWGFVTSALVDRAHEGIRLCKVSS